MASSEPLPRTIDECHQEIRALRQQIRDLMCGDELNEFGRKVGITGDRSLILLLLYKAYPKALPYQRLRDALSDRRQMTGREDPDDERNVMTTQLNDIRRKLRKTWDFDVLSPPHPGNRSGYALTPDGYAALKARLGQ